MIAAVLSDLDGVLVDSGPSTERVYERWAAERGLDPAILHGSFHGIPAARVVAKIAPHLDAAAEAREIDRRHAAETEGIVALPGAADLLARDGVAIVTSGIAELARSRLAAAGLPAPAVVVTADRVRRGKPDPEPYLLAARELGADPARCVVLEDAPAGIEAGLAAGAHVVGILTTHPPSALGRAHELAASVAQWLARSGW